MCVSDCSQGCQKKTLIPFLQILVRKNIIIDLSSVVFNELHKILKDSFATSFTREGAVHLFVFCVARRASWVWPHLPPLVSSYCESLSISTARYFFEKVILFIFCGCFNSGFLRGCNVGSQGRQGGASVLFWWRRFGEVLGIYSWLPLQILLVLCPLDFIGSLKADTWPPIPFHVEWWTFTASLFVFLMLIYIMFHAINNHDKLQWNMAKSVD